MSGIVNNFRETKLSDILDVLRQRFVNAEAGNTVSEEPVFTQIKQANDVFTFTDAVEIQEFSGKTFKIVEGSDKRLLWVKFESLTASDSSDLASTMTGTQIANSVFSRNGYYKNRQCWEFSTITADVVVTSNESSFDFNYNSPFSISFWYLSSGGAVGTVIAKATSPTSIGWNLHMNGDLMYFNLINTNTTKHIQTSFNRIGVIDDASWHHIVYTYSGSGIASGVKLYIDGTLRSQTTVYDNLASNSTLNNVNVTIGADGAGGNDFGRVLDEVMVYNFELSQTHVTNLYNNLISYNEMPIRMGAWVIN